MTPVYALVDCNNFYASCERLFRPDLNGQPIIVLSNNDGCVVARSAEAKALGIRMGVPEFQIRSLIQSKGVHCFSSNYTLYADISSRVMRTLEEMVPEVEIYSIDEAFLELTGMEPAQSLPELGRQIRERIQRWIGITVCVGIAPTKTLAKLANHAAKIYPATRGVVDLRSPARRQRLLAKTPVGEVWGIGRQLRTALAEHGIHTAADLAAADPGDIRRRYSLVVARIVSELNGVACLELESLPQAKKQIVCSRSFGQRVTVVQDIRQAVAEFTVRAVEKLRGEKQRARTLTVFMRTSHFNFKEPQYANSMSYTLPDPTQDSRVFIRCAHDLVTLLWRDGFRYAKAGVMLSDFYPEGQQQLSLFAAADTAGEFVSTHASCGHVTPATRNASGVGSAGIAELSADGSRRGARAESLMRLVDQINRNGRGTLVFATQLGSKSWALKRENLSPAYTTRWDQIPCVK